MSEAINPEIAWLTSLTAQERARVLARLVHGLTIAIRCLVLSEGTDAVRLERVRQANEVQHRVAGYLQHALSGDEEPGWIRVVVAFVFRPADDQVRVQCNQAWADARQRWEHGT